MPRRRTAFPLTPLTLARFPGVYLRHLAAEIDASRATPRKGVMPGVRALLDALVVAATMSISRC